MTVSSMRLPAFSSGMMRWTGIVNLSRGGILLHRWRGGSVQRSPWHAYRAAPSQERGAKKVYSTELS
jgi:hypothetical protein